MLLKYKEPNPSGRPRKKLSISKDDQAVVYDFLVSDTTATQAAKAVGMPLATYRNFVSYVVQYWINTGFMGFTRDVNSKDDFEEREE